MEAADALLQRIESTPALAGALVWPGDFDIERRDPVERLSLPCGLELTPIAGDGAGGTYFLCGPEGSVRPVLYADSEGQATLMAADLTEAVTLIAAYPYWRELMQGFPAAEMESDYRDEDPDFPGVRAELLRLLGIAMPPVEEAVARLRAAAERTVPDFLPVALHPEGASRYDATPFHPAVG